MVAGELRDRLARASFELEPAHPRFATRTRSSPHSSGASGVTLDTTPVPKKQRGGRLDSSAEHRIRAPGPRYACTVGWPEKWQRNALFKAVVAGGLHAIECTFDYTTGVGASPTCRLPPMRCSEEVRSATSLLSWSGRVGSGAHCHFHGMGLSNGSSNGPGRSRKPSTHPTCGPSFNARGNFSGGARYDDVANTPFIESEQTEIARQLREITDM